MAQFQGRYQLASADIACEEFDGEMVVLNLASGKYFALNRTASFLMTGLLQGHALEDLAAIETPIFGSRDVVQFFQDLVAQDLIAAGAAGHSIPIEAGMLQAAQSLTEKPLLEVHDDLADLILADPIHETDDAIGWPARARAA